MRRLEEGTEELTDGGRVRGAGGGGGEKSKGPESSSRVKAEAGEFRGIYGKTIDTAERHQSAENERMGRKRQELAKARRGADESRMMPPNINVEVAEEDSDSDSSNQSLPYSRRSISSGHPSDSSSDEEED